MTALRTVLSALVLAALGLGYLASQYAFFARDENGSNLATQWSKAVDVPPVVWISLIVLLGSIVLSLIRDQKEPS